MKKNIHCRNFHLRVFILLITLFAGSGLTAQVIRPYTNIYSDNIRGGHTTIGNTITAIYNSGSGSTGIVNTAEMNDFSTSGTGNYTYGRTSAYGNDNSNIQFVDADADPSVPLVISGDAWTYSNANAKPAGWPGVSSLPGGPGASPLGYGPTGTVATTLTDRRTYYFTRDVNIVKSLYGSFTFTLKIDDGAVIYINGTEVSRINMNAGIPDYNTDASSNLEPEQTFTFTVSNISPFVDGVNTIQAEVHSSASNETGTDDLFFLLEMTGNPVDQTLNSSSANLTLPAGNNTIKFARLYWGGRINGGMGGDNNINLRTARIKFNSEAYLTLNAASGAIDKTLVSGTDSAYQAYFDVTNYVNNRRAGTYTLGNITAATGAIGGGGYYAGWAMVVVYENPAMSYSSVRIYDGFLQVYNGGSVFSQTITLNGLNPPVTFSLPDDAYMSTVAWEGDANLAASFTNPEGDYMKVNGVPVFNAVNPVTNIWNGTISRDGVHLTGDKNPDFLNQMGIDIDEVHVGVGFGINANTTDVTIEFGTEADQYFPSVFAFTMQTRPPLVLLDKIVKDTASGNAPWQIPNNLLNPNEILTYTITGKNMGTGNALNCVIIDTLPASLSFRSGSLKVNAPTPGVTAGIKTESGGDDAAMKDNYNGREFIKYFIGTGSTASAGGTLAAGDSFSVQFQCVVPSKANILNFVSNTARITGTEQDGITSFIDDGTAIIGPMGIGLPVKFIQFTVNRQNNTAVLNWSTATETRNDRFDVEKSYDGINFIQTGSVNGHGTSTDINNYTYYDPLNPSEYLIYYRLKIVDIDNKSGYSNIVMLRLDELSSGENIIFFPNPFRDNLKLQIRSVAESTASIKISNTAGQLESQYTVNLQPGMNIVVLSKLETLQSGIHLVEIVTADRRTTLKIVKQ